MPVPLKIVSSAQSDHPTYVAVDLRSFPAGRPPLLDLYHLIHGQYILYCEANIVFTQDARYRLLLSDVSHLYVCITAGRISASGMDLADFLSLPDDMVEPQVKTGLVYNSAVSMAQVVYTSPSKPESLVAAQQAVGQIAACLSKSNDSFQALANLMHHDFSVYCHAVNVCTYSLAMGQILELDQIDIFSMSLGAFLHDVGKTNIPKAVLDKKAPLTDEEWQIIRRHPDWGIELLASDALKMPLVRTTVIQHQERFDGSGYPNGLKGQQIHPLARIVQLADIFDALTSIRPYRTRLGPFEAMKMIREEIPGKFDADLFRAFVKMLGRADN